METPSAGRTGQDPRSGALREEGRRRGNQDDFVLPGTRRVTIAFVTVVACSSALVTPLLLEVALQSEEHAPFVTES